jgi:hypothetical protein
MKNFHPIPMYLFHPLEGKKIGEYILKFFLVQTSVKFTLKKVRETFPEFFQGEKEILWGGITIFHYTFDLTYTSSIF